MVKSQDKLSFETKILEFSSELLAQDNIDSFIDHAIKGLVNLYELENAIFIIDNEENKKAQSLKIRINEKEIGELRIFPKEDSQKIDEKELKTLSNLISQILSKIHLVNELKTNNEDLAQQDKAKSELLSTVSHELRTPMANILGFSELLMNKEFDGDTQKQYNQEIYKAAQRLSNLINNFLDLSRLENAGTIQLTNFEEIEIDWLAEKAWEQLCPINDGDRIEWNVEKGLTALTVDSDAITRVFLNIFSNAIKYSNPEEKIKCSIEKEGKQGIRVKISDSGIGIKSEEKELIFERFYRADNPKTQEISGTGLGLWISKQIIDAHQGKIWCESEKQGTSFIFTLGNNSNNAAENWLN